MFYMDDTVREGSLMVDKEGNKATYIDYGSKWRKVDKEKKAEKKEFVVSVSGPVDSYFYKEKNKKLIYYEELLRLYYMVVDSTLTIKWTLEKEKKVIDGVTCNKATTNFRGRKWIAWYNPDMPEYFGPWKFYGLPGVIYEVADESKRFVFVLERIDKKFDYESVKINLKDYKNIDLKTYDELRIDAISLKALSNQRDYIIEQKPYKRNGIELIYEWEDEK